ncbi:accessory gene regulator ArgB-like protein [Lacrimispora sp. 38-1]|uniref:accessory gene regulator ArgB-like protein n=1 Tax=Lacrimispora sp. 38-1 TaxID=3125778 RepID=UPI003CE7C976
MERLAKKAAYYLLFHGRIKKEDYHIYKYGIQTGIEMLLCLFISSIIAVYLKSFTEFCIFIAVFFSLRSYVGGLHFKRYTWCCICSCLVISSVLVLSRYINPAGYFSISITIGIVWTIYKLAPATAERQIQDEAEAVYFSHQRRKILSYIVVFDMIFWFFNFTRFMSLIMYIMIVILSSMLMELSRRDIRENISKI